ncbi:MAG: ribosome maturation factor RimM [Azoarcus sp.]|jgi:16S rRNA processing protein RimM|nr:ribosome maturation factor RimM [Azoarcus sp.]
MIVLGRIVAPFGIKGWLKIQPLGDVLSWEKIPCLWLAPNPETPNEQWAQYPLLSCQAHGKGLIAGLKNIADRNAAEQLCGWYIAVPRESLPRPEENEYYWDDLIGLAVLDEAGESLGKVTGLLSTGAHDVLKVTDGDTERLIPFVSAYVQDVNPHTQTIRTLWQKDW